MAKGQAALEFLMTYGWALLALLAVVAVLGFFMFRQDRVVPGQCHFSQPFSCVEYKAAQSGVISLGLVNSGKAVQWVNLTVNCNQDPAQVRNYEASGVILAQQRINGSLVEFVCPVSGGRFAATAVLQYQYADETVMHEGTGEIRTHVES